jgi:hypothetical protein
LKDDEYGTVYATFPPGPLRSTQKDGIWGIIVQMAEEGQIHLRFYCSAETETGTSESSSTSSPSLNSTELQRAQGFTNAVADAIVAKWGRKVVLGAIDSRWNQAMRDVVESRELAECIVFLAPGDSEGTDPIGSVGGEDHIKTNDTEEQRDREENERLAGMGLRVDRAREEDVEMVSPADLHHTIHPVSNVPTIRYRSLMIDQIHLRRSPPLWILSLPLPTYYRHPPSCCSTHCGQLDNPPCRWGTRCAVHASGMEKKRPGRSGHTKENEGEEGISRILFSRGRRYDTRLLLCLSREQGF